MAHRTLIAAFILSALSLTEGIAAAQPPAGPAVGVDAQPTNVASPIYYEDSLLVVSGTPGAAAILFQEPSLEGTREEGGRFLVKYRWRFRDNSGKETEGEGGLLEAYADGKVTFGRKLITAGPFELNWTFHDVNSGLITFDPSVLMIQQTQRSRFEEVHGQDPFGDIAQPRPRLDLLQFIQPDPQRQEQLRNHTYQGQTSSYLSSLTTRIRYVEESLVVATPAGIGVYAFQRGYEREGGGGMQYGTSYRYRAVAADGSLTPAADGDVFEQYIGGNYDSGKTRQQLEAGPVHIGWSRGGEDAGWLYFDPAWHAVWILSPEAGVKLLRDGTPISELQRFRYGRREPQP